MPVFEQPRFDAGEAILRQTREDMCLQVSLIVYESKSVKQIAIAALIVRPAKRTAEFPF